MNPIALLLYFMLPSKSTGIVVGKKDCKIEDVIQTLENCTTFGVLIGKWPQVARKLGVSSTDRNITDSIKVHFLQDTSMPLEKVLEKWVMKNSTESYLETLIETLKFYDLTDAANCLTERFQSQINTQSTESNTPSPSSSYQDECSSTRPAFASSSLEAPNIPQSDFLQTDIAATQHSNQFDLKFPNKNELNTSSSFNSESTVDSSELETSTNSCSESQCKQRPFAKDLCDLNLASEQKPSPAFQTNNAHTEPSSPSKGCCHRIYNYLKKQAHTFVTLSLAALFLAILICLMVVNATQKSYAANGEPTGESLFELDVSKETDFAYKTTAVKKSLNSIHDLENEIKNFVTNHISSFEIRLESSQSLSVGFDVGSSSGFLAGNITLAHLYLFVSNMGSTLENLRILANQHLFNYQLSVDLQDFPKVYLPSLQAIYLQNLYNSDDIYLFVTDRIVAENLQSFTAIVAEDREYLKDVDTCSSTNNDEIYLTTGFCRRFPNIKYFSSNVGKVSTKILHHTGCFHMKHLLLNLANCEPNIYSDSALTNRFQEIERANITIFAIFCSNNMLQSEGERKLSNILFNVSIECSHFL